MVKSSSASIIEFFIPSRMAVCKVLLSPVKSSNVI